MKNNKSKSGWVHLAQLKYPLHDTLGRVVLPAGTRDVDVKFHAGAFTYLNDQGERVRVNKYRHAGAIYYGH
jgi:hypothetical protein